MKEDLVFFKEFFNEMQNTGSCFQTTRWAADALISPMDDFQSPRRILEIGPGIGSVTTRILAKMKPGDKLTLCEINERFMEALKEKLIKNKDYLRHAENIEFFLGPMQSLPETQQYDLIVCALPFLNFELSMVKEIFEKFKRLGQDHTVLTYYEYIGIRSIGKSVASTTTKRRLKELDYFFKSMYREYDAHKQRVWLNLLPIYIYTLKLATVKLAA